MERPKIRAARADDVPEMVRIQKDSLADTYGRFLDEEALEPWVQGEIVETYVAEAWPRSTVAEMLGEVVGLATIEGVRVDLLWVRADRRRQGVGGCLMDQAERQVGVRHAAVELECFVPNRDALRFYARRGYRAVRRYLEPLAGVEKAVLRKPLARQGVRAPDPPRSNRAPNRGPSWRSRTGRSSISRRRSRSSGRPGSPTSSSSASPR